MSCASSPKNGAIFFVFCFCGLLLFFTNHFFRQSIPQNRMTMAENKKKSGDGGKPAKERVRIVNPYSKEAKEKKKIEMRMKQRS